MNENEFDSVDMLNYLITKRPKIIKLYDILNEMTNLMVKYEIYDLTRDQMFVVRDLIRIEIADELHKEYEVMQYSTEPDTYEDCPICGLDGIHHNNYEFCSYAKK